MRRLVLMSVVSVLVLAACGKTEIDAGRAEELLRGTTTSQGRAGITSAT